MRSLLRRLLPRTWVEPLRRLHNRAMDLADRALVRRVQVALGMRDELAPPPRLLAAIGVKSRDFRRIGRSLTTELVRLGGLGPTDRVLDIGCGTGLMAAALTRVITTGSYEGFDIVDDTVDWCRREIAPRHPAFAFRKVDVHNALYNPAGNIRARDFAFPYRDAEFDFAFLTSIFTHMLPPDVEAYIAQIARVLRADGRCFATFFLLNEESIELLQGAARELSFRHAADGYRIEDATRPELAVAYTDAYVRACFERHSMAIERVAYGSWCGRTQFTSYQDIVVARRRSATG
jgi:SAM-dependent methyltransferase